MTCSNCKSPNADGTRFCTRCGAALVDVATSNFASAQHSTDGKVPLFYMPSGENRVADALIGRTLDGKYRIDARLGDGGMGMVYRATRLHIDDAVALKVLRPELLADPQAVERFRREARAAALLKHPNVVTIHDFGITVDGTAYLIMELIEGQSLRAIINSQGRLAQVDAVEIACQACAALDEAHRYGVIHRDLKPENIIVSRTPGGLRVKVLDFGIAKLGDLLMGETRLTQSGMVLGTPMYMSPEQCMGEQLDGRSDIYSLGIVLYEMLSGSAPFNAPSMGALIIQHVQHPPPPLSSISISTSPAIEAAVKRALEKTREARPQSARDFSEILRAALKNESLIPTVSAEPPIFRSPGQKSNAVSAHSTGGAVVTGKTGNKRVGLLVAAVVMFVLAAGVMAWRMWPQGASGLNLPDTVGSTEKGTERLSSAGSIEKLLAQAENDYRNGRYDAVIVSCTDILAAKPDQSRAGLLIGESYYNTGNAKSAGYLGKAIDLGETVTLPIKHHHYEGVLKLNDGFCSGYIRLKKGLFEFHSDEVSEHSFTVTPDKVFELRDESYKNGRLHMKAGIMKAGAEVADNYNFYAPTAGLRKQLTLMKVYCENPACQPMAQTLYQLLAQLKK